MVGPRRSAALCIYVQGRYDLYLVAPSPRADRLDGRDRPAWCWLMTALEEQYFAIVIQNYLQTICTPSSIL